MKILITGGSGFIGSSLSEYLLEQNHDISIIVRSNKKNKNIESFQNKINLVTCDVTDEEKFTKSILDISPDAIFHFAGQLTTYESFDNPLYDVEANSKSTLIILEAIRKLSKPCRFLLGSTFWVIGRPESLPVTEKDSCKPRNIYAANRLASEHYCSIYNIVYGLDTIVIRFTNTYGEKEQFDNPKKAALNYLLYKAFNGEDVPIYNKGEFFRDYIHVNDVISACDLILRMGKTNETYFVGSGTKTWFKDIAKIIEDLTSAKIKFVEAPPYHQKIDIGNFVVDNSKLCSLGWNPTVDIKTGISGILEHFKTVNI